MKQLLLSISASIFFVAITQAQNQQITGSVLSIDGKPITNAHVLDINSRQATATDQWGIFQLSVADSGTVLRVSHVGFRPVLYSMTQEMRHADIQKNSAISITLSHESTMLSPAVVSVSDKVVIDGKRGVVLRDFSFVGGNNLLLLAEKGIRHLVLCNESWEEVSRIEVGKKDNRLYEDCLGNVHLFGDDSVYQVAVNSDLLELIHASEQAYFLEQLAHCSTSSDSHLFFSSYQKAGQEMYHYGLDRNTKKGIILQHVYDHYGLQDIEHYFSTITLNTAAKKHRIQQAGSSFGYQGLEQTLTCYNDIGNNDQTQETCSPQFRNSYRYLGTPVFNKRSTLLRGGGYYQHPFGSSKNQYYRSVSNRELQYQQVLVNTWSPSPRDRGWLGLLSQPTYSPMFNLRDSIFVFDHVVGVCYVHDAKGKEARSFPIEHQEVKGWRSILIPDESGEKLFAQVKNRGKVFLLEVDLNNGSILSNTFLSNADAVEHLKIKDGYAYYLKEYRDIFASDRMLKQKL